MANKTLFLISLFISLSLRTLSHRTTTLFNVSTSLHRTRHVTTRRHSTTHVQNIKKPTLQDNAMSSLSLSLHPRSSLHEEPEFRNYTFHTRTRLARDSVRVKSILSNIGAGSVVIDMKTDTFDVPLTSGVGQGSGEYFARLAIGDPPTDYYFVTDTGSDVSWLQCSPCSKCYKQSDPLYDPTQSTTYRPLSCYAPQCSQLQTPACESETCIYQVSYGDGSVSVGNLATETLTFGTTGSVNDITIGCGHINQGLFIGAAGLLGLGGGPLSLPSQIQATSFSYCLVDRDSTDSSTLDFNKPVPNFSITVPLLHNSNIGTYYYVEFVGFEVGGKKVEIPNSVFAFDETSNGGVIIDSGTAVTRLKKEAYIPLRDAFRAMTQDLPTTDGFESIFDTCYDFSGLKQVSVPFLWLVFADKKVLELEPENYLVPVNDEGKHCFAFAPIDGPLSIIGNVQQQGIRVTYDLANSVIGFSPDGCGKFKD